MTRRHLEILIAVAEEMNMTSAAQKLFISQSAVSQTIKDIERHYDILCFERLSKKLYLTPAGQHLLSYARHINRLYSDLEDSVRQFDHLTPLRIGASVTVATSVLPIFIKNFQEMYPSVKIRVIEDNTSTIEQMLLEDQIDIGFVEGEISTKDLIEIPVLEDHLIFVCSPLHPFASLEVLPVALENQNFVLREYGSGTRKKFEETLKHHHITWQSNWTCNNADTIKAVVAEGLGITVISYRSVERHLNEGSLSTFTVKGIEFNRSFRLIKHKDKFLSNSLTLLEEFALKSYKALD